MNFYTKLIGKIDPVSNAPLFKSVQIQLACQACIDAERGHECTHNMHLIAAWHTQEKHDRLRTIMSDRPDLINSEMSGVAFSSVDQCFRPPDLKRMFQTPPPISISMATKLITCIDPCAGGEHSDFAVVTMVYQNGIYQVAPPPPFLQHARHQLLGANPYRLGWNHKKAYCVGLFVQAAMRKWLHFLKRDLQYMPVYACPRLSRTV